MTPRSRGTTASADVVIIGAGIIGAATAHACAQAGLSVLVVDRGAPAGGTSSHCEGNILVSDKHGVELALADYSLGLWRGELAEHGDAWEFEAKGGIIVASTEHAVRSLDRLVPQQRGLGIDVEQCDGTQLRELEPWIRPDALAAAYYPGDSQIMPIKAVHHLLALARAHGAQVRAHTPVTAVLRSGARITGVRTPAGDIAAGAVVNAAGPWAGEVARLAGVHLPIAPRKGFVMVTEAMPPRVFHKVYAAEYIDNVGSGDSGLQTSPVVESALAGSILIGSSRERVGFDPSINHEALTRMARAAVELFPFLQDVRMLRHYHGFRPYSPDHLPVIGPDPRAPGLWHASGHEGAGIGLSAGTARLLALLLTGATVAAGSADADALSLLPHLAPERFEASGRSPVRTPADTPTEAQDS